MHYLQLTKVGKYQNKKNYAYFRKFEKVRYKSWSAAHGNNCCSYRQGKHAVPPVLQVLNWHAQILTQLSAKQTEYNGLYLTGNWIRYKEMWRLSSSYYIDEIEQRCHIKAKGETCQLKRKHDR